MTARGFYSLLFAALMLFSALSVGNSALFLLGCVALAAWLLSLAAVLTAFMTLRLRQHMDATSVLRGESCLYRLEMQLFAPIPIAPVSLRVCLPNGRESEFLLSARMLGTTQSDNAFSCPHVGVFPVGVVQASISDCFGLFILRRQARGACPHLRSDSQHDAASRASHAPLGLFSSRNHTEKPLPLLTVLPNPLKSSPLTFSPGDGEAAAVKRAQSDHTTPEDVRTWQDGDELKRVHWKLSMRRQELWVHTYETPQRPDALILLDCAPPQATDFLRPAIIDALCESCVGVVKNLLDEHHIVRMPLPHSREISAQMPEALHEFQLALAQERFDQAADFTRTLLLSSRRMRRTGSTIILTSRLTPKIADAAIALAKAGPHTRFTLVTAAELSVQEEKLLNLLLCSGLEATHVRTRTGEKPRS